MILSAPAIILTAAVTLLAVVICIAFAMMVSRARRAVGIPPPAMGGDPRLERALRVQGNTVEGFIAFLPALWLAALYFQGWVPPAIGLCWCLGRILFAIGYMKAPKDRRLGFALSILSVLALIVLAAIGIARAWLVSA